MKNQPHQTYPLNHPNTALQLTSTSGMMQPPQQTTFPSGRSQQIPSTTPQISERDPGQLYRQSLIPLTPLTPQQIERQQQLQQQQKQQPKQQLQKAPQPKQPQKQQQPKQQQPKQQPGSVLSGMSQQSDLQQYHVSSIRPSSNPGIPNKYPGPSSYNTYAMPQAHIRLSGSTHQQQKSGTSSTDEGITTSHLHYQTHQQLPQTQIQQTHQPTVINSMYRQPQPIPSRNQSRVETAGAQLARFFITHPANLVQADDRIEQISNPVLEALGIMVDRLTETIWNGAVATTDLATTDVSKSDDDVCTGAKRSPDITSWDIDRYIKTHLEKPKETNT